MTRRSDLFALQRGQRSSQPTPRLHQPRENVVDRAGPIDLRYPWQAGHPVQPSDALQPVGASFGGLAAWTSALDDGLPDTVDLTEVLSSGGASGSPPTNLRSAEAKPPLAEPPASPTSRPDQEAPTSVSPSASPLVDAVPSPPPAAPMAPRTRVVLGQEPPVTQHDDRFMKAISDAARGANVAGDEPAADEQRPGLDGPTVAEADDDEERPIQSGTSSSAALSHAIFERLGENIAQATTYDVGTFTAEHVFDQLDRDLGAPAAATADPGSEELPAFDVVEDLAAILAMSERPEAQNRSVRTELGTALGKPAIERLQNYLDVSDSDFATHEARYFDALKEHLVRAGAMAETDPIGRATFDTHVAAFQRANGLTEDGVPGEDTLWELQHSWALGRNLDIDRVDADVWLRPPQSEADYDADQHGYRTFRLRSDAAAAYAALRAEAEAAGVPITSGGAMRDLGAAVTSGRSSRSMHYSGLALDLATVTGMRDAAADAYLIESEGDRWRVWARVPEAPERDVNAVIWAGRATSTQRVSANVVDFTAMAERHGFHRISPRSGFPGDYLSAEWWHFQATSLLVPWVSQFGIELLALRQYDDAALRAASGIWNNRKSIFARRTYGRGWH